MNFSQEAVRRIWRRDAKLLPVSDLAAACDFAISVPDEFLGRALRQVRMAEAPESLRKRARQLRRRYGP